MNFTLHQLQVFVVIVEKQSITKAAELLNMTQPAVSIQLKKLQDQFDLPLTELIGRRIFITDFGKELYRIAQRVLHEVNSIGYEEQHYKGILAGKLRISVVSTGKYVMPQFLQGFLEKHPKVDLDMDVTNKRDVIRSLEENKVDFSLVTVLPPDLAVEEEPLMPNRLFLFGKKEEPLVQQDHKKQNPSLFRSLPLIYREEGSGTRHVMQQYFHEKHIRPKFRLSLTSSEAVKQAILAGLGYSVLSIVGMKNELQLGQVKIIPVKGFPLHSHWRLIWRQKKQLSSVANGYLQYIRENKQTIYRNTFAWMEKY
ncbi:MAG TPA: LysR family transcriptional regulator [Sediminibacterium sp.]|nr:LysR family transcriptional regulator [Sediminibacterium sp.]